jgi:hypothetical protein
MLMTLVGECFMVTAAAHELTSLKALHLNACSTLGGALKAAIPALPFTIADEPAPCQSRSTPPPQYPKSEPASMCGCSYGGLCLVRIPYTCGLSTIQLTGFITGAAFGFATRTAKQMASVRAWAWAARAGRTLATTARLATTAPTTLTATTLSAAPLRTAVEPLMRSAAALRVHARLPFLLTAG